MVVFGSKMLERLGDNYLAQNFPAWKRPLPGVGWRHLGVLL